MSFEVKDSGERQEYPSGMVRDTQEGKPDYALVYDGPLIDRLAEHLTKGANKYGKRNWQLADSQAELDRFKSSAARHFRQWLRGDVDEDHFAATVFNLNAVEYVNAKLDAVTTFGPARVVEGAWPHMVRDTLPLRSASKQTFKVGDRIIYRHFKPAGEGGVVVDPPLGWAKDLKPGELVIQLDFGDRFYVFPEELEHEQKAPKCKCGRKS